MHTSVRSFSNLLAPSRRWGVAAVAAFIFIVAVTTAPYSYGSETPNPLVPVENFEENLWGFEAIGTRDAWKITRGKGVLVAVIDTGVDGTHNDLIGRVVEGRSTVTNKKLVAGENNDSGGHGTHVAGIIAAADNGSGVVGVAPEAMILPVQVLGAGGIGSDRSVADGIDWAVQNGAQVINLSLGGEMNPFSVDASRSCAAVSRAFDADVVVIVSAGNDGDSGNPKSEPASCRGALSVTAVDENLNRSYFSSFDTTVGISAPGSAIISSLPSDERYQFGQWNGTSMAAPYVAGAAALIRAANPLWDANQIINALKSSAVDMGPKGTDPEYGAGFLDVSASISGRPTATNREKLLAKIGTASVPTITSVTADGKKVIVRWNAAQNVRASSVAKYRIEFFNIEKAGQLTSAENLQASYETVSGASFEVNHRRVPEVVRVTAIMNTEATMGATRTAIPFLDVKDITPKEVIADNTKVTAASAIWTLEGLSVSFETEGVEGTVGLTVNIGSGEFFFTRTVQSSASKQIFQFTTDSPARAMNVVVGVASGQTSLYATLPPQYLVKVSALTAGKKYLSFVGSTKESCNSKMRTGCAGTEVQLRDAQTDKVVARTWVLGNLRYGFDILRTKTPNAVYVSTGKTRSMTVTTPLGGNK